MDFGTLFLLAVAAVLVALALWPVIETIIGTVLEVVAIAIMAVVFGLIYLVGLVYRFTSFLFNAGRQRVAEAWHNWN